MELRAKIQRNQLEYYHSGEQYGEWRESWENTFLGVEVVPSGGDVFTLDGNMMGGDDIYIVWVEWSSGDSFGNSDKGDVEVVASFKNRATAEALEKAIYKGSGKGKYSFKFQIDKDNPKSCIDVYEAWEGYFESLDNVYIEKVTVPYGN